MGRTEITEHEVLLAHLSPGLDGLRIVQLSDLHAGWTFRRNAIRQAVSLANECAADMLVLTGDLVNHRSLRYLPDALAELGGLRAACGAFACLGNHDYWEDEEAIRSGLEGIGIRVLVNEGARIAEGLWLAGLDDMIAGEPDVARLRSRVREGQAVVLLSHNPLALAEVAGLPWLVLAGHTHGGQLALPVLGPRRTPVLPGIRWFTRAYESFGTRLHRGNVEAVSTHRYPAGWYNEGRAWGYVSRGLGTVYTCPVRLNCPAEISCFTLRPGGEVTEPVQPVAAIRR